MPITHQNSINIQSAKKWKRSGRKYPARWRARIRAKYVTGNTQSRVIINISSGFETVDKLGTTRRANKIELLANKTRKLGHARLALVALRATTRRPPPKLWLLARITGHSRGGKKILGPWKFSTVPARCDYK